MYLRWYAPHAACGNGYPGQGARSSYGCGVERTTYADVRLETDVDRRTLTWLYLDDYPSSALDSEDPTYLAFEYMAHMRVMIQSRIAPGTGLRALHLGGAGCALPTALDDQHSGSKQIAVEYDRVLAEKVRTWFTLPRSPRLKIRVGEGRDVMNSQAGKCWDVIVRDAFVSGKVPPQLRTLEAHQAARDALSETGMYLVNVPGKDMRDLAGILHTFPHVIVVAAPKILDGKKYGNLTVGASRLPWPSLHTEIRRLPDMAKVYHNLSPSAQPYRDPDTSEA